MMLFIAWASLPDSDADIWLRRARAGELGWKNQPPKSSVSFSKDVDRGIWHYDGTNFTLLPDGTMAPIQWTNPPQDWLVFTNLMAVETNLTVVSWSEEDMLTVLRTSHLHTNIVNALVEQGDVCKVRGHRWGWRFNFYAVYQPGVEHRECSVCGKIESRSLTDWK